MHQPRALLTLSLLLTSLAIHASAQVVAEGSYWLVTPEGNGSVGIDGVEGTDVDLEDDLGYGDDEGVPSASVYLGNTHQIGFSFLQLDIDASSQLERDISYEGLLFRINSQVTSALEATVLRGEYRLNLGNDNLRGGIVLGGQYLDLSASIESPDIGEASADLSVGMPVVGAFLRLDPIQHVTVRGSAIGLTWDFGDVDATYIDAEASAIVSMDPGLFAGIGYRHLAIDVDAPDDDIVADLTFTGPFLVGGFEW